MEKLHDLMAACKHLADIASKSQHTSSTATTAAAAASSANSRGQQPIGSAQNHQQQEQQQQQGKALRMQNSQSYDEILQLFTEKSGSSVALAAAADAASEAGSDAATASTAIIPQPAAAGSSSSNGVTSPADAAVWLKRWRFVACALVNAHVQQQQPATAFQLLNQLLIAQPEDPWLWTVVGRLQLQLGHVQQAEQSFQRAEQGFAVLSPEQQVLPREVQSTLSHNQICLKIMSLDLQGRPRGCGSC